MSLIFLLLLLLFVADVFDAFDCCWQQDSLIICISGWLLNCLSDTPSNMVRNLSLWSWKSYNMQFAHKCLVALTENSKLSLFLFCFFYRLPKLPLKLLLHGEVELVWSLGGTQAAVLRAGGWATSSDSFSHANVPFADSIEEAGQLPTLSAPHPSSTQKRAMYGSLNNSHYLLP